MTYNNCEEKEDNSNNNEYEDDLSFRFDGKNKKDCYCNWAHRKSRKITNMCYKRSSGARFKDSCPVGRLYCITSTEGTIEIVL